MKTARKIYFIIASIILLGLSGCVINASTDSSEDEKDQNKAEGIIQCEGDKCDLELLATYKKALPKLEVLKSKVPQPLAAVIPNRALFPSVTVPIALSINGLVVMLLEVVEKVVQLPPTFYNSKTKEFVWGPFDNRETSQRGDMAALYIKDNGEDSGEDFRFVYAFLRGVGNDIATYQPVIWGGANPDLTREDFGNGVILWDFEANYAWEEENNPGHEQVERGRFVTVYSRGEDENNPEAVVTWVVATFRNFVPKEAEEDFVPADLDYFWGGIEEGTTRVDFLNFLLAGDIDTDPVKSAQEDLNALLVFINAGSGRAEVTAENGDIAPTSRYQAVECWDDSIIRTYLELSEIAKADESVIQNWQLGNADSCVLPDIVGIPTLADIDQQLLDELHDIAENGVPPED